MEFILELVPAVEHSFYWQIFKLFEATLSLFFIWTNWLGSIGCYLVETVLNKKEACRFENSNAVSKNLKTGTVKTISSLEIWKFPQNVFVLTLQFSCMVVLTQQTFVLRKTSWRRLDQDEYVRLSLRSSEEVLVKTNISVLAIRLQDVFKTSSRHLQDVLPRHLQDVLQWYLQDIFKKYHQIKLFLLTRLWEAFNTFLRGFFSKDGYLQRDMPR